MNRLGKEKEYLGQRRRETGRASDRWGRERGEQKGEKQTTTGKGRREKREVEVWMEGTETNHAEPIENLGGCNAAANRLAQVAVQRVDWKQGQEDELGRIFYD
ncbi:hypothetical protein MGYG_05032 [Nannizzia gypsea CBS 118893]|uniref:Uncharacterized protein n=1 Tax=Arthroderma gypseum (strain ATCC MYA-4604 / CBS 118893) TaxID=535722 RepID=E4UY67_ARTGP|nr:hypothetical protein MGYG_05032 [Nannizzia gypsea CBS 118893]EFR02030.1 hypothetical protein MGYG_05032 [Nannizzia gypsea CBS 118893]